MLGALADGRGIQRQLAALQLTRNPRIATEVCKGIQYPCMCCGTIRHDVLWEYDLDRREVLGVTCVDRDACEERYVEREAERAAYMAAHEGGWA